MSFKNKNNKKINYDKKVTLESKHNSFLNNFIDKEEIQTLENEKNRLEKEIKGINDIEKEIEMKDRIIYLKEKLGDFRMNINNTNEIEYYLDNGNLIFNYFDSDKNDTNREMANTNVTNSNTSHIMSYFTKNECKNTTNIKKKKNY